MEKKKTKQNRKETLSFIIFSQGAKKVKSYN